MRISGALFSSALLVGFHLSAAQNPATIPAPGPQAWVVDRVGVLSPGEVTALNALGDAVHQRNGAVLAVVVIDSTKSADPRRFATDLFNRWRLGSRERDNGLLLFVALNDRAAEVILGDGIDSDTEVAASERIMRDTIVPRFRAGEPAEAIRAGAHACAERFFGETPMISPTPSSPPAIELERPAAPAPATHRPRRPARDHREIIALGAVGVVCLGIFGPIAWVVGRAIRRHRPRRCRNCALTMQRLDETADDAQLGATEQSEERIGSVDYDVWQCSGCNTVEKVRYGRWFTRYSQCPLCGGVTKNSTQHTLQSATTMSTGLVEVHEKCAHCAYSKLYTRVTPRVIRSSSSSSSGGSRSSGGGSSSGRGASGRW